MSLFRRFFVGAGYSLAGAALHRVLISGSAIVIARWLGVKDYGVYVNLIAVVNLTMTVGLFGLNVAFPALIPGAAAGGRARALELVLAGLLFAGAMLAVVAGAAWLLAPLGAGMLYRSILSAADIRMTLPYMIALTLNTLVLSALYGLQEFRRYSLAMMSLGVLVATGSVVGVWQGGLPGLLAGGTIAYGLSTVMVLLALFSGDGARPAPGGARLPARVRELVAFALPAFLGGLFMAPAYWFGNMMMVRAGGSTPSGFFGVAVSLSQLVMFVPLTLAAPLLPMMSEVAAGGDRQRFSAFVARNARMIWCIDLPITVGIGVAAPVLIHLLYGARYAPSVPAFVVLSCSNLLLAVQGVAGTVFMARRRMWAGFAVNAAWFVTVLALTLPLARHGQLGFALALLLAYVLNVPVLLGVLGRHVDLRPLAQRSGAAGAITLAGLALMAACALASLPWWAAVVMAALGAAGTAVLEWRFVLDAEDRALVGGTLAGFARRLQAPERGAG